MGLGELIGMRYILWERDADGTAPDRIAPHVLDSMMQFINGALGGSHTQEGSQS